MTSQPGSPLPSTHSCDASPELEARIAALEADVATLRAQLDALLAARGD